MLENSEISFKEDLLVNKYILFDQDSSFREKSERSEFLNNLIIFFKGMKDKCDLSNIKSTKKNNNTYIRILASIKGEVCKTFIKYHNMFGEMLNLIEKIKKNDDFFLNKYEDFANICQKFNEELLNLNTSMTAFHKSAKEYESFLINFYKDVGKTHSTKETSRNKTELSNSVKKIILITRKC